MNYLKRATKFRCHFSIWGKNDKNYAISLDIG